MNRIPNTKGNAHAEGTGGEGTDGPQHPAEHKGHIGKSRGKDGDAHGTHHKMNKHHGMKHAMGHVDGPSSEGGGQDHEETYCCDE